MDEWNRRQLVALGGALALGAIRTARSAEPAAPPGIAVPGNWRSAPRLPLWSGRPPGSPSFNPGPVPADWPDSYLRSVATPELHVFRPPRPNGRAFLVMPG